jgi:deoxyribodipyrimidine photolyase-related protein
MWESATIACTCWWADSAARRVSRPPSTTVRRSDLASGATTPYIASAAYLKRQSGLSAKGRGPVAAKHEAPCARCAFDPDQRTGEKACPFNAMYWDFLAQHRERLSKNLRMRQMLTTLDRFGPEQVKLIRATAAAHRATLTPFVPSWTFREDDG